jgi:hypothetical protein
VKEDDAKQPQDQRVAFPYSLKLQIILYTPRLFLRTLPRGVRDEAQSRTQVQVSESRLTVSQMLQLLKSLHSVMQASSRGCEFPIAQFSLLLKQGIVD